MSYPPEPTEEEKNKPYNEFLYFVALTIMMKLFPFVEGLSKNNVFSLILGFAFVYLILKLIVKSNCNIRLKSFCEAYKIKPASLYVIYLSLYFPIVLFAF